MPKYEPDPQYVDNLLDALAIFKVAAQDLADWQSSSVLDDDYVTGIWNAMERKARAEAELWKAYGD